VKLLHFSNKLDSTWDGMMPKVLLGPDDMESIIAPQEGMMLVFVT
jgi:hypothetical protein